MGDNTRARSTRASTGVHLPHRVIRSVGRLLPRTIRHEIWRALVRFSPVPPSNLSIKLAETSEEYEQAFALLYNARLHPKQVSKPSPIQPTKWHALPTTRVIIAKLDSEVVATVTVIRDSALGLPVERGASVDSLRRRGTRLAQIASFATRPPVGISALTLALPLFKYVYEYCIRCFGVDTLVTAVDTRKVDILQGIFFFNRCEFGTVDDEEPTSPIRRSEYSSIPSGLREARMEAGAG